MYCTHLHLMQFFDSHKDNEDSTSLLVCMSWLRLSPPRPSLTGDPESLQVYKYPRIKNWETVNSAEVKSGKLLVISVFRTKHYCTLYVTLFKSKSWTSQKIQGHSPGLKITED